MVVIFLFFYLVIKKNIRLSSERFNNNIIKMRIVDGKLHFTHSLPLCRLITSCM